MQQTYLIVGGSRGMGKSTAQLLQQEGHKVYVIAREKPDFDVDFFACDVLKDELPSLSGPIHGLLYCPGSINLKPFKNLKTKDFESDYAINVLAAVDVLQQYSPNLKAANQASVVLFSTVAVQLGMPFHASIAAAKGAVEGLVRSLAAEWAPKIRVNGIAPSITQTDLAARLLRNEKQLEAAKARHPLGEIGQPEDAGRLAMFLLTADSSWISGQIMALDGGMSSIKKL